MARARRYEAPRQRRYMTNRVPPGTCESCGRVHQLKGRAAFRSFDLYVRLHPEGESFRAWLTNNGRREVLLVPGCGPHGALPGGYVWAIVVEYPASGWRVIVHDNDDASMSLHCESEAEARRELEVLKDMAPFGLRELALFGYQWEN
jgi:hypothetical protein